MAVLGGALTSPVDLGVDVPDEVIDLAARHVGPVGSVTRLGGGLSAASVVLLVGARGALVAKGPAHPREQAFYEHVRVPGLRVPRLLDTWAGHGCWLLLEHLPDPLPRSRWCADPQVAASLRALHDSPRSAIDPVPMPFQPRWDDELHDAGVEALDLSAGGRGILDRLRELSAPLLEDHAVISADTNALNWRVDHAGRPVLLDWERIGLGHPAVDLGISLPGLPSPAEAEQMVAAYGGDVDPSDLLVAKAWSLVEFAAQTGADPGRRARLDGLRPALEDWLATVSSTVARRSHGRPRPGSQPLRR